MLVIINRYGNPDIGSGHHVHRRIVIIERIKHDAQKMRCRYRMERLDLDIRDVVFGGNSFDRTLFHRIRDQCTRRIWLQCVQEAYRYVLFLGRQDASRM